jgi:hypothetical protein
MAAAKIMARNVAAKMAGIENNNISSIGGESGRS